MASKKTKDTPESKKRIPKFTTHEGHPLTPGESHFIDAYIQSNNGQQSYMEAYPNSNPKNARQNAERKTA